MMKNDMQTKKLIDTILTFDDLNQLASFVARKMNKGGFIGLIGDLGTGKTTFAKKICQYFNIAQNIKSPTFTYVIEYLTDTIKINHFDVYRILEPEEIYEIGFEDYLNEENSLSIIEWADNILDELPKDTLFVEIKYFDEEKRKVSVYYLHGEEKNYVDICINNNNKSCKSLLI